MSFDFYFFIFRLSNVLSVNTKSLFELSSGLSNIFLIATAADNYIYKVGSFAIEIKFQNKRLVPILKFKEFSLYNIITTKATFPHFVVLKVGLIVEKLEEHKSLFKLDGWLLQSINLCLANRNLQTSKTLGKIFVSLIFLGISLFSLSTTFFLFQLKL